MSEVGLNRYAEVCHAANMKWWQNIWYSAGCPVHWHGEISDRFPIATAINEKDD